MLSHLACGRHFQGAARSVGSCLATTEDLCWACLDRAQLSTGDCCHTHGYKQRTKEASWVQAYYVSTDVDHTIADETWDETEDESAVVSIVNLEP